MNKDSLKTVELLLKNWYSEYDVLNYSRTYPYRVVDFGGGSYSVDIRPSADPNFFASVIISQLVHIAEAACVDFHMYYLDGLVFTLH